MGARGPGGRRGNRHPSAIGVYCDPWAAQHWNRLQMWKMLLSSARAGEPGGGRVRGRFQAWPCPAQLSLLPAPFIPSRNDPKISATSFRLLLAFLSIPEEEEEGAHQKLRSGANILLDAGPTGCLNWQQGPHSLNIVWEDAGGDGHCPQHRHCCVGVLGSVLQDTWFADSAFS